MVIGEKKHQQEIILKRFIALEVQIFPKSKQAIKAKCPQGIFFLKTMLQNNLQRVILLLKFQEVVLLNQPEDVAIIDMLASTGMRVGEMVLLNRNDIDFNERECIVFGKGSKERVVYFDARTKIHLQNYLESRNDNNPALFVSLKSPYDRLKIGGIEVRLREFGKQLGINKVHPHKFRRTLATVAIDKGMPIEQLQQLLGHRKIDTTLQYAMVKQSNVKIAHRKYIG